MDRTDASVLPGEPPDPVFLQRVNGMEGKFEPHFELQIGPVLGTDEWESNYKLRFAPNLKPEDYEVFVQMLRGVADVIEEEYTPVRRDPGRRAPDLEGKPGRPPTHGPVLTLSDGWIVWGDR